jgi:membrane protease YdiL (CAAX protease family)
MVASTIALFHGFNEIHLGTLTIMRRIFTIFGRMLGAGFVLSLRGWDLHQLGFRFSWLALLAGVPLFLSYMILYVATFLLIGWLYPLAFGLTPAQIIPQASGSLILFFIFINSVFEEAAVSGYVVTALTSRGAVISITASTLIRLAYHLYNGPIAVISFLPMGFLFAFVYWKWRNLWPLITAHSLLNIWLVLVVPYLDAN